MLQLSKDEEKGMYDLLKSTPEDTRKSQPDAGLFELWDYLEHLGYPDYQIQEFVSQKGDWVQTRAMLMELTGL